MDIDFAIERIFKSIKAVLDQSDNNNKIFKEEIIVSDLELLSLKDLNRFNIQIELLIRTFPTILKEDYIIVKYNYKTFKKCQLKFHKIPFKISNNHISLRTIGFRPIILMMYFLNEYSFIDKGGPTKKLESFKDIIFLVESLFNNSDILNKLTDFSSSRTSMMLHEEIGSDFSYGELLDCIDRYYDIYKQLFIHPHQFYLLFCSFGSAIVELGDLAFEKYNFARDKNVCWEFAIKSYLKEKFNVSELLCMDILSVLL